jgi:ethanolamine ammonia-lyase small subunit
MNDRKIKEIQNNVAGSMAVEGKKPSENAEKINTKFLKGEITSKQAIRDIKKSYGF